MAYDITALKTDLSSIAHGSSLNQVQNINALIYRAARQVLEDVDPQETIRITPFTSAIYNSVYDYSLPVDLKGNKIIDIAPQVNRMNQDIFPQKYNQDFDVNKLLSLTDSMTIQFNSSLKTIRINAPTITVGTVLNQCDATNSNGLWIAGGGATALTVDNINYVSGGGSLQFNLSAGQPTGYLENSTMNGVDLSGHLNQSTLFLYTYMPTASNVTSVNLRWGTDASNYYSVSATTTQENTAFINGWNLLAFNWLGATVVGMPTVTNIKYARVTWTYNSTLQTAMRLDNIISNLGNIMNLEYYSKYIFRDVTTGAYQETVTDDSNLINLDTESYNLLFNKTAFYMAQQMQGLDALFYDANFFDTEYQKALTRYMAQYKSQVQKPQSKYYVKPTPSYQKWLSGRNWGSSN